MISGEKYLCFYQNKGKPTSIITCTNNVQYTAVFKVHILNLVYEIYTLILRVFISIKVCLIYP